MDYLKDHEPQRRRNIVLSYMREGVPRGIAVRNADKLLARMERWQDELSSRADLASPPALDQEPTP
jgi:hypothetical protein